MKPTWTHLDLARAWDARGNRKMVMNIAKSFFRLKKMKESSMAGTMSSR